jgi:hypothetical protein
LEDAKVIFMRHIIALLISLGLSQAIFAETDSETLKTLDEECALAREAYIAPLREKKIEQCVVEDGLEREECELQFKLYGYAGYPHLGLELPECLKSHEAYENRYK